MSLSRAERIPLAAGALALAYMRLMDEGDVTRASLVLAEFQTFWNNHGGLEIVGAVDDDALTLEVSGGYDVATASAVYYTLQSIGLLPDGIASSVPTRASGVSIFYRSRIRENEVSAELWGAHHAAVAAPLGTAGSAAGAWAYSYVEGLRMDGLEDALVDALEDPVVPLPGARIEAPPPRSGTTLWPWAIAAGVLIVGGIGLAARRWGRR